MGKSSKDKRDVYYRLAKEQNWRARSAFKLIQIDEEFDLFSFQHPEQCTRVVDLCAAPGSWSQVLSRVLIKGESFGRRAWIEKGNKEESVLKPRENVKIVAIDLQPMAELSGVTTLKADITHHSTVPLLLRALDPDFDGSDTHRVDLLISDGAPDVTGLHDLDIYVQAELLRSALSLAAKVLRPGGKFVAKIFRAKNVDLIYAQLKLLFDRVTVAKPRSSRASSLEAFVVCEGYNVSQIVENTRKELSDLTFDEPKKSDMGTRSVRDGKVELHFEGDASIPPFLACGDLSAWDADASYKLPPGHVSLDPVQPPTAPPYKEALERKRAAGGAYGKTKNVSKQNG
ncbi:MAG: hypothetical protein Q9160_005683 [Pyrenula sp. 1 TL-2023]